MKLCCFLLLCFPLLSFLSLTKHAQLFCITLISVIVGKSTAQQIVLRFYDVSGGVVKVDGTEVQDLNVQWLRQQIGYVAQNPVLFSGSVRENILLGCPEATEEEIVTAAKAANAHEFVSSLSDGYDTDIGTGGNRLSGGQKQRLW